MTTHDERTKQVEEIKTKRIGFVLRQAPYGNSLAHDAVEAALAASIFEQDISLFFIGDGVFQLLKNHNSNKINQKNLEKQFSALSLYDINKLYISKQTLIERNITEDDLSVDVSVLKQEKFKELMHQQDTILTY